MFQRCIIQVVCEAGPDKRSNNLLVTDLVEQTPLVTITKYRWGMVNSNMDNSKFHLIRSFFEFFAIFLSFHVYNV